MPRPGGGGGRSAGEAEALVRATVDDLVSRGARKVREEHDAPDVLGHVVMLDPEGNEFCVA